jgi:hypothetical protein
MDDKPVPKKWQKTAQGVEQTGKKMTVAPSPFNAVKLDLAIILIIGLLLFLLQEKITANLLAQILILSTFSLSAMLWLIVRTNRIVRGLKKRHSTENESGG